MARSKVVAVVIIALALGFVVGFKSGKAGPSGSPAAEVATPAAALPRLVDLGSTTCIPCKRMAPILEELKHEYQGKVDVEFIDVNVNATAADEYKITVIPTQVFMDKDGQEVFRHEGFFPKADILAQFEKMGIETH